MSNPKSMKITLYTLAIIAGFSAAAFASTTPGSLACSVGGTYATTVCGPGGTAVRGGIPGCKLCCREGTASGALPGLDLPDCLDQCDTFTFPSGPSLISQFFGWIGGWF